MLFKLFILAIVLTAVVGIYCLVATKNLIRVLISMELINKSAVLLMLLAGLMTDARDQAESFIIALIVIEVVVTAIGAVLAIAIHAKTGSVDVGGLAVGKESDHA